MIDFTAHLTITGTRYDFVMNECKDDSPWVGPASVDGVEVCWSVIEEAIQEEFGLTEAEAEAWVEKVLQELLDLERATLTAPTANSDLT